MFVEGLADFFDCGIGGVVGGVAYFFEGDAEADGGVLEVEVHHVEVALEALGEVLRDTADEGLVFAETHGGDVGELVVFVDEGGVGVGSVTAAGEDVEDGDGVARGEPVGDGDREREGCVVAVRREDEDLQVRLLQDDFIYGCPAGRARTRGAVTFVTFIPCLAE